MFALIVGEAESHEFLAGALGKVFDGIEQCRSLRDRSESVDWSRVVVIFARSKTPDEVIADLEVVPLRERQRSIVFVGEGHDLRRYAPLVNRVGALLPSFAGEDEVLLVARLIRTGLILLPTEMLSALVNFKFPVRSMIELPATLTAEELDVLELVADGLSERAISIELELPLEVVSKRILCALTKMSVRSNEDAANAIFEYRRKRQAELQSLSKLRADSNASSAGGVSTGLMQRAAPDGETQARRSVGVALERSSARTELDDRRDAVQAI